MITEFFSKVFSPAAPAEPEISGEVALAALMVRAAKADGSYHPAQLAAVDTVLRARFGHRPGLRAEAEALDARIGDTVHLTRRVKDLVPLEGRHEVLRDMWRVILADGQRHEEEAGLMRLVSTLIGLSDRDSAFARQDVMREAG